MTANVTTANAATFASELTALRESLDWSENHHVVPSDPATVARRRLLAAAAFCATMCWTMAFTIQ